ncbi:MAG: cytochrome b/b6 domain-containing protein [bacterium]
MATVRAPARERQPEMTRRGDRILRNGPGARSLHAAVIITAAFLLVSGVALMWGLSSVQDVLGGHVAAGRWHRWIGFGVIIALGLLVPVLRFHDASRFVSESVRFRRADLRWFLSYPLFVLRPSRHGLPWHAGHFDPGQRALNIAFVAAFIALSVTGLLMAFPDRFQPFVFAWSLRVHRIATLVFVGLAMAHIVVASGLLPAYRGTWRAMWGSGRVDRSLAQRLWPGWAERAEAERHSIQESDPR